ncbi:zf-UBP-domain-containing protein [Dentipellis sp. KUC8613]|nr:zf-UBP-domain-containing protein [Dentipellis sp. KUC8613]
MRAYHIRIVVHPKLFASTSHPQPTDTFIPTSLWQHLPAQTPKPTTRRNAIFNPAHKDYRFGPVRIDWVDFETMSKNKEKEQQGRGGTITANFVPHTRTKSGSTNLPDGVIHLFRDSGKGATEGQSSGDELTGENYKRVMLENAETDGVMLGILAVPAWMMPADLLAFVAPAAEGMAHLRILRDSVPNRSIVLMKFRKAEDAAEFAEAYNGKPFNSMEAETCHVVHVSSVSIDTEDSVSLAISRLGSSAAPVYELPTCPVCLERMDSAVTGLVTVPCAHTFHCMCLSKWGDSRCPVCRYSQTLRTSHPSSSNMARSAPIPFADPSSPSVSRCVECASTTNLWICLICGNVGCGRYGRAHAQAHYERTTHLYALELETQRVWDYAGDGYVHRLIQNKADGKLVELPSASMAGTARDGSVAGGGPSAADSLSAEKIEAIGIEYSYLLTSQLDSQRAYYEGQIGDLRGEVADLKRMVERLGGDMEKERKEAKVEKAERAKEESERLAEVERDKAKAERRAEKMAEIARNFEKELREERAVSEGLLKNLEKSKERAAEVEKEKTALEGKVNDLEDELRDVMFFLEARAKIEEGGGPETEAAGGSIELPASSTASRRKAGKKKVNK